MLMDAELLFCEEKQLAAGAVNTDAVDLGKNGAVLNPLVIQVNVIVPFEAAGITLVKLQSCASSDFSSGVVDEASLVPAASINQTAPCVAAQFFSPVKPGNRYVRLEITSASLAGGSGTPTYGKVTAFYTPGIVNNFH